MSTLEATVDMMERLSEENLVKVQYVTRQQANAGRYRDAQEVVNDIRRGVLYKNDKWFVWYGKWSYNNTIVFFGEKGKICDIAIATFSREIFPAVLKLFENEKIGEMKAANRIKPVYLLNVNNLKIAFYLSEIGASLSGTDIIEVNWMTGAKKFILFGSAGSLDKETTKGKYVIPYEAYRDEGMSYHYASPKDYIQIKNAEVMENIFKALELPYVMGKVWTTDAIYRETRNLVEKRKSEGCIAVEMELAGMQAVCDFYNIELYDFLVTGDIVDQLEYTSEGLHDANHNLDKFYVALKIAEMINKGW